MLSSSGEIDSSGEGGRGVCSSKDSHLVGRMKGWWPAGGERCHIRNEWELVRGIHLVLNVQL